MDFYFYLSHEFDNPLQEYNLSLVFLEDKPFVFKSNQSDGFLLFPENNALYDLQENLNVIVQTEGENLCVDTLFNSAFFSVKNDLDNLFSIIYLDENAHTMRFQSNLNLLQWTNPSEASFLHGSKDFFIAPFENKIIVTHVSSDFFRVILNSNRLPVNYRIFEDRQLSMGLDKNNNISVNNIMPFLTQQSLTKEKIYIEPFSIQNINITEKDEYYDLDSHIEWRFPQWTLNMAYGLVFLEIVVKYVDLNTFTRYTVNAGEFDIRDEAEAYYHAHHGEGVYNGCFPEFDGNTLKFVIRDMYDVNGDNIRKSGLPGKYIRTLYSITLPQLTVDMYTARSNRQQKEEQGYSEAEIFINNVFPTEIDNKKFIVAEFKEGKSGLVFPVRFEGDISTGSYRVTQFCSNNNNHDIMVSLQNPDKTMHIHINTSINQNFLDIINSDANFS